MVLFGTIWFIVNAPPPRILQVSQWLCNVCQYGLTVTHEARLPENVLAEVLSEISGPSGLAAVADTLVFGRHVRVYGLCTVLRDTV